MPMEDLDDDYGDEPITTNGNHNNHVEENYVPPAPYPVTTTATNGASSTTPTGGPRSLKPWPLPPSLTPKKRGFSRSEVPLDLDSTPDENGAWKCGTCEASYDSRIGLFAHTRFCAGRVADWACEWCSCNEHETNHKASGPSGPKTLCAACGQRYRHGAEGMPQQNAAGEWLCPNCNRPFPTMGALGGHRRFCDGGVWRCQVCGRACMRFIFIMFALSSLSSLLTLLPSLCSLHSGATASTRTPTARVPAPTALRRSARRARTASARATPGRWYATRRASTNARGAARASIRSWASARIVSAVMAACGGADGAFARLRRPLARARALKGRARCVPPARRGGSRVIRARPRGMRMAATRATSASGPSRRLRP